MKDYYTELWLADKFECTACKEVRDIDFRVKTPYGEELCDDCSQKCDLCENWHRKTDLLFNKDDSEVCPECRDFYFHEIADVLKPYEKPQKTSDWWNDLYTDALGNCWSDADSGL